MALVQTVAMVTMLTVGISFARTEQTEAADNIQLISSIEISAQENEEAEYEFSVSETGYYKIYSEICEYEFYGTLYEKVNGEWKMLINYEDTHTNSNFVIKYAFHAGTDYKIKVRETENQQLNATIYVEKWEPDVTGVRSKNIYCNVGDDIELKPYLVVENEQVVEDLGVEGIPTNGLWVEMMKTLYQHIVHIQLKISHNNDSRFTYKWYQEGNEECISTQPTYNFTGKFDNIATTNIECGVYKDGSAMFAPTIINSLNNKVVKDPEATTKVAGNTTTQLIESSIA